ncbi:MAG: amino acid permease [Bacteroidetes bacterium]|nr:amino acid permease [Bacteroidota bacterium]
MAFKDLFRKKSVTQILKQVELEGSDGHGGTLSKHLGVRDLTALGIAAIIGAGIFTTIGKASFDGGPGVIFLFLFTAIACGFAAFAYAEFASMLPVSGSAYTYSYVAFGELFAWIIGWALIMEYAIGNIAVAIGWSGYFTSLLESGGIHLPAWLTTDVFTAHKGFNEAMAALSSGSIASPAALEGGLREAYLAWTECPKIFGLHIIFDAPAVLIVGLITWLVYRGIKESRNASNAMVIIKLAIILLVIAVGIFYVDTDNWDPFAPNGITGILKGVSAVFFAYIGFDAISTTAEECKDPQRDLPRGMMWAIVICTVLYVLIALVLTGMVSFEKLNVDDPLAFVFQELDLKWLSGIIAVSAIVAMASVLLVFQLGQPRIWMSMSRDGLLPKRFAKLHPRFKTPSFATIVAGLIVGGGVLFMNLSFVTDLTSIGTLFAFVLVCAGVLRLETLPDAPRGKFRTPYFNSQFVVPVLVVLSIVLTFMFAKEGTMDFLSSRTLNTDTEALTKAIVQNGKEAEVRNFLASEIKLAPESFDTSSTAGLLNGLSDNTRHDVIRRLPVDYSLKYQSGLGVFAHNIPMWIFILITFFISYRCVMKKLSLIPVLGLLSCLYMMAQIPIHQWLWFTVWLVIGLVIYFNYGRKHSRLAQANNAA